ncbi:DUF6124 family protein [Pseudomonas sp. NA13]
MFKITPIPEDESKNSTKPPTAPSPLPRPQTRKTRLVPGQLFIVAQDADMECLLANLSETLASVNVMANKLSFDLEGAQRSFALGIQQMVELSELLANRALDIAAPR